MFCSNCGAQITEGADVCLSCGKMVKETPAKNLEDKKSSTLVYTIFGFIFAAVAVGFFPPIFGGIGILFGFKVKASEQTNLGIAIIIINIICLVFGMILGALVWS